MLTTGFYYYSPNGMLTIALGLVSLSIITERFSKIAASPLYYRNLDLKLDFFCDSNWTSMGSRYDLKLK
mgnify:CR=1 FL=1